jgi:hypothetical protein
MFTGFFTVGLCGFGGVLPWVRRMLVEQLRWVAAAGSTELLALCQFLLQRLGRWACLGNWFCNVRPGKSAR